MKKAVIIALYVIGLYGCGISNIVNRGEYIDHQSIKAGIPRVDILSRFGSPIDRKSEGEQITEIFRVPQGETTSGKILKGGGLLVLDVLTLGLTEIVAAPVTDGKNYVTFKVTYDKNEIVREFLILSQ